MKDKRPVNLDLMAFKFPIMAKVSILHRISGVILFLFLPVLLYMLYQSLQSQQAFLALQNCVSHPASRVALWVLLSAVVFHVLAGIRHILMDFGWGEGLTAARITAVMVMLLAFILAVLAGVWLW